jgi:hypothetical protein
MGQPITSSGSEFLLNSSTFNELCNLCVDPEKPVVLDPIRREICLEYTKRSIKKKRLQGSIETVDKLMDKYSEEIHARLSVFLLRIMNPFLSIIVIKDKKLVNCMVRNSFLLGSIVVENHSVATIPFEMFLPLVFGGYVDCNFIA